MTAVLRRHLVELLEPRRLLAADTTSFLLAANHSQQTNSADVDSSGYVSALDALIVINETERQTEFGPPAFRSTPSSLDVNQDGSVTPEDAFVVIDLLDESPEDATVLASSVGGNLNLYADPVLFQGGVLSTPTVGQKIGVQLYWSTDGLAADANYDFQVEINGYPLAIENLTIGAGNAGQGFYFWTLGGWFAEPGTHTVTVTMDPDDRVQETNENDNVRQITFTSAAPADLPQKFIWPVSGEQNVDWTVGNYLDVDPGPAGIDFRGGPYNYNGHPGVDISPANFSRLDEGIAVLAMADGTVTEVVDGNPDRESGFSSINVPSNFITIDHGNGWQIRYFHVMRDSITAQVGDSVTQGEVIATMGSSGASANLIGGPHLHFDVSRNGTLFETSYSPADFYLDPLPYQADTIPSILDLVVSTEDAFTTSDGIERMPKATEFSTLDDKTAFLTYFFSHLNPGDEVEVRWRRPNGQVAQTNGLTSSSVTRNGTHQWVLDDTVWKQETGNWNVEVAIAGQLQGVTSFEVVSGATVPEIRVRKSGELVLDGRTSAFDLGNTTVGAASAATTFTIENEGGSDLVLTSPTLPDGFSFTGAFPTSIAAGNSANFAVQVDGDQIGHQFGDLRFSTNDPDEGDFDFIIEGEVSGTLPPSSPTIDLQGAAGVGHFLDNAPVLLQPNAEIVDPGSTTNQQATLLVKQVAGTRSGDWLDIRRVGDNSGEVNVDGNHITYWGLHVATLERPDPNSMLITFGSASNNAIRDILRSVTWTTADSQSTAARTVQLIFTDADGLMSKPVYRELVLGPANAVLVDPTIDLAEHNASDWSSFPSADSAVSDSAVAVTSGLRSIHFDTQGPFDTGVSYPAAANAVWNVTAYESFAFDLYAENNNPNGFQGNQPILVLNAPGGSVRYEPTTLLTPRNGPTSISIPLSGNAVWTRTVTGSPDLTQVNQFEIHHDTWDSDFEIWFDRVRFVVPELDFGDAPTPYPTSLVDNGATHAPSGPLLGQLRDGESDALPNFVAGGDDIDGSDDEDGVRLVLADDARVGEVRVKVLNFDPIVPNSGGDRLHEFFQWSDPHVLANQYIDAVAGASDGTVQYVVESWQDIDDIPVKADGFDYTTQQYVDNWQGNSGWHQPDLADYEQILSDFNVADGISNGEFDEVWMIGGPFFGFFESAMAGPGAFFINGGTYPNVPSSKPFAVMGFSMERTVAEMLHNLGHRAENHLRRSFGETWDMANPVDAWDQFTANVTATSGGPFGVGNLHFPFNGTSDYDYSNLTLQSSYAYEFENYPNHDLNQTQLISSNEWVGTGTSYEQWWLDRLPDNAGVDSDGRQNNWWKYIFDFQHYSASSGLPLSSGTSLGTLSAGQVDAMFVVSVDQAPSGAKLDAWVDFNGDGQWDSLTDQVADSVDVANGENMIVFSVPPEALAGRSYARFRLSTAGGLEPTGAANDGEVEDYLVDIVKAPSVETVLINGGDAQRSGISSVQITFDQLVDIETQFGDVFRIQNTDSNDLVDDVPVISESMGKTVVELSFMPGPSVNVGGGLVDGNYAMEIDASRITVASIRLDGNADGTPGDDHAFGAGAMDDFYRRYGDQNGNQVVDLLDFAAFRQTFGKNSSDSGYQDGLDFESDGTIGLLDFAAFRQNFGT